MAPKGHTQLGDVVSSVCARMQGPFPLPPTNIHHNSENNTIFKTPGRPTAYFFTIISVKELILPLSKYLL